jgi:hypothetical protein
VRHTARSASSEEDEIDVGFVLRAVVRDRGRHGKGVRMDCSWRSCVFMRPDDLHLMAGERAIFRGRGLILPTQMAIPDFYVHMEVSSADKLVLTCLYSRHHVPDWRPLRAKHIVSEEGNANWRSGCEPMYARLCWFLSCYVCQMVGGSG